ncbi:S24 family peptidase [Lewinella sp. LCG006]|uniref:S24 family peptidase n=1 Tax=Lewinella sp. LCG006 TaxID=3231911 RepID=UPI0034610DD2
MHIYKILEDKHLIRGKSDLAKHLGTYNHVINSILQGKRNLTVEQIHQLCETFDIDANYLFGLDVPPFRNTSDNDRNDSSEIVGSGRQNIRLVPQKALAGYALDFQDPTYFKELPGFSIPGMEGELLAFPVSGDSMLPTITSGDLVICEALERPLDGSFPVIRDNEVYVIVSDVVVVKRVQQLKTDGQVTQLLLISDNTSVYQPYQLDLEEIKQVLRVKRRLTGHAIS